MSYVRADPNHSGFAYLSLALGITIFSKSTTLEHFLSKLDELVKSPNILF
jgi:hypothetical protein